MSDRGRRLGPVSARGLAAIAVTLGLATALVIVACSFVGSLSLPRPPALWTDQIWHARLGRLLAAAVVGAGLGVGGAAAQALLRNPLADPFVLGVSTGAAVGVRLGGVVASGLVAGAAGWLATPLLAFSGAALTSAVVYAMALHRGRLNAYTLLLAGVIVNTWNGAVVMAVQMVWSPFRIDEFGRWAMGELPDVVAPGLLAACAALVLGGWTLLLFRSAAFNVLALGPEVARSSGVSTVRLRTETFVAVSAMAAAAVALAGPVSFVGLIVPHLVRMLLGPDHRRLTICSGFVAAILMVLADTLCRTAGHAVGIGKIPVGIVTALLGAPWFIHLLRHDARRETP